jgi:hypothetical protein
MAEITEQHAVDFNKAVLDRLILKTHAERDFHRNVIIVSPQVKRVWQSIVFRIADRQWRKRDWGKPKA